VQRVDRRGSEASVTVTPAEQRVSASALIESVGQGVHDVLAAPAVLDILPEVLPPIARLLQVDRVVILAQRQERASRGADMLFRWEAPDLPSSHERGRRMMVAIEAADRNWGHIVYDGSHAGPGWGADEQRLLRLFGQVVGAALMRERSLDDNRNADARIERLARSDALTGLANRVIFGDRLRHAFAAARRGAHGFAVLYLDLDHFKEINDTLGHTAGDKLLQQVASRLRHSTRETDVIARIGGDEFAVLQAEVQDSSVAGRLAEKLIATLSAPYMVDGNDLRVGASVGIAVYEAHVSDPDSLLVQADQALYRAKDSGRGGYRYYSDEIDHEAHAQLALAKELREGLGRSELELRYQPQVELATGRIVGMEALLRWHHPTRGSLLPEDFLPVAEKFGIMPALGRWTLDQACRQMAHWLEEGLAVPMVAVNVSLTQIKMGAEFVRQVRDTLERWHLRPDYLELDVTELLLARATLAYSDTLQELRRLGVSIAIDDFGAKYSSLNYLRTYQVNRLKIARGMVAAAAVEPGSSAMVRAILSLAGALGVEVVAEGVETEEQRSLLVNAGPATQGQGFYYSRAVPAEETVRMLRLGVVPPAPEGEDREPR
jgi:diguanylate cyclase (GGDEF)-like protein